MRRCFALALLSSALALAPAALAAPRATAPVATRDTTRLGVPFQRWTTPDRFGRTITFYLSVPRDSLVGRALPLVLVIDGSGSQSVWTRVGARAC